MRRTFTFCLLTVNKETVRQSIIGNIQYHYYDCSIRIDERSSLQLETVARCSKATRTFMNELGKMSDVRESRSINYFTGFRKSMYRSKTEITYMIGASFFIQKYIPVGPEYTTSVQVVDDIGSIRFS